MNTQKRLWLSVRTCLLVLVIALCISACAGTAVQVPAQGWEKAANKDVLQTCAVICDQDMREIRGGYDVYSFGMDFVGNFDFATRKIDGSVTAWALANTPLTANFQNGAVAITPGGAAGVSFQAGNGQVAFQSSVGNSSLGTGVIQLVQVMGNNNLVYASTNVTLNILNFKTITPTVTGRSGLNFMGLGH